MHKTIFAISSLIFSVGFFIWSISHSYAFPQGPNVSLGYNPIVSVVCTSGYTVPSSSDFVITDFIGVQSSPYLLLDGNYTMQLVNGNSTLNTGWLVPSGSVISCTGGTAYFSGYLVHN